MDVKCDPKATIYESNDIRAVGKVCCGLYKLCMAKSQITCAAKGEKIVMASADRVFKFAKFKNASVYSNGNHLQRRKRLLLCAMFTKYPYSHGGKRVWKVLEVIHGDLCECVHRWYPIFPNVYWRFKMFVFFFFFESQNSIAIGFCRFQDADRESNRKMYQTSTYW